MSGARKPPSDPKRIRRAQRDLDADHQPRRLAADPGVDRISRADERDQTARVRRAEADRRAEEQARQEAVTIEHRARVGQLVDDALDAVDEIKRAVGYVDRDTYRDLDRARAALARLKSRHA